MGDGADDALERAFNDEEEYESLKRSNSQTQFDSGFINEQGGLVGEPWSLPVENKGFGRCPICGSSMAPRINNQTGVKFYGCTRYPKCKGNRSI